MELEDDDFSDLDAIIAESEQKREANRSIAAKHRRLTKGGLTEDERLKILAEIRLHEDLFVWRSVAVVALFHSQHCLTCGHEHKYFLGWMTQQNHRRDPNCRRLIRGRPIEQLPYRIECHTQPEVEVCSDCIESVLAIEEAANASTTKGITPHASASMAAGGPGSQNLCGELFGTGGPSAERSIVNLLRPSGGGTTGEDET